MAAKSPRSKKNPNHQEDAQKQKRNLIDSLELLRGGQDDHMTGQRAGDTESAESEIMRLNKELEYLHNELRMSRSASTMLEGDLRRMEQKALETIAENGNLKRLLDQAGVKCCEDTMAETSQREQILDELSQSRNDHLMLTQALIDSENEIARLTRTLEKLSRRLCAA